MECIGKCCCLLKHFLSYDFSGFRYVNGLTVFRCQNGSYIFPKYKKYISPFTMGFKFWSSSNCSFSLVLFTTGDSTPSCSSRWLYRETKSASLKMTGALPFSLAFLISLTYVTNSENTIGYIFCVSNPSAFCCVPEHSGGLVLDCTKLLCSQNDISALELQHLQCSVWPKACGHQESGHTHWVSGSASLSWLNRDLSINLVSHIGSILVLLVVVIYVVLCYRSFLLYHLNMKLSSELSPALCCWITTCSIHDIWPDSFSIYSQYQHLHKALLGQNWLVRHWVTETGEYLWLDCYSPTPGPIIHSASFKSCAICRLSG